MASSPAPQAPSAWRRPAWIAGRRSGGRRRRARGLARRQAVSGVTRPGWRRWRARPACTVRAVPAPGPRRLPVPGARLRCACPSLPPEVALRLLPLFAGLATVALLPAPRPGAARPARSRRRRGLDRRRDAGAHLLLARAEAVRARRAARGGRCPGWPGARSPKGSRERPPRERVAFAAVLAAAPWTTFGSAFPIGAALASGPAFAPGARRTRGGAFAGLALRVCALVRWPPTPSWCATSPTFPRLLQSWQPDIGLAAREAVARPPRAAPRGLVRPGGARHRVPGRVAGGRRALRAGRLSPGPRPGRSFLALAGGRRRRARRRRPH